MRQSITFRYNSVKSKVALMEARLKDVNNLVKVKNPSLLLQLPHHLLLHFLLTLLLRLLSLSLILVVLAPPAPSTLHRHAAKTRVAPVLLTWRRMRITMVR